jgi:hypothetical protein
MPSSIARESFLPTSRASVNQISFIVSSAQRIASVIAHIEAGTRCPHRTEPVSALQESRPQSGARVAAFVREAFPGAPCTTSSTELERSPLRMLIHCSKKQ